MRRYAVVGLGLLLELAATSAGEDAGTPPATQADAKSALPATQGAKAGDGDPLFPYRADDRWGYIDARGTWAIAASFKEAGEFSDGLAAVRTADGSWGYIDRAGRLAVTDQFDAAYPFSDGLAVVQERSDGKPRYRFVNAKGETVAVVDKYPWVDQ